MRHDLHAEVQPQPARLGFVRILSRYFIGRFLGLFAMVLAVAFLVLATIELVLNLDDVSDFDSARRSLPESGTLGGSILSDIPGWAPLANTLSYLGLRLTSYYLADVLPIASFIAVFIAFAIAGRSMELLAIEAGGIRPTRIVVPVLAAALILSLATALLHETVILRADRIWSGESHNRRGEIDFGRDAFWYHKGRTITNVAHADSETRTLHQVEIFERSPTGGISRVVRADRVQITEDGLWQIEDAYIWRFDPDDIRAAPSLEKSASIVLDLDSLQGDLLLRADPGLLPLPALARYLDGNPEASSSVIRRAQGRYHERLSRPWLVFVFAWLAMPFALRIDERGHFAGPAAGAVVALGLYFLVENAGRTLAQEALIPVGITPWLTMALFSLAAAVGVARQIR